MRIQAKKGNALCKSSSHLGHLMLEGLPAARLDSRLPSNASHLSVLHRNYCMSGAGAVPHSKRSGSLYRMLHLIVML